MKNEELLENEKNEHHKCEKCNFICRFNSDWERHIKTKKHKVWCPEELIGIKFNEKNESDKLECTYCKRKYKTQSGLWKHDKICNLKLVQTNVEKQLTDKDLILMLIKENSEFKNMMMEVIKNGTHNTTNNNCNNKTFNLQVFLNETCKDAMNIMDFIDSIQLQLSDLESVGQLGYVKGISNIIVSKLRALDVTKRPVHCSDAKREILYVKDNDVWEKEGPENNKMQKAVKYIAYKNILLLPKWREKYPECVLYNSPKNDIYNQLNIEAMGGDGSTDSEKMNKIIRNIAREVVIEKN